MTRVFRSLALIAIAGSTSAATYVTAQDRETRIGAEAGINLASFNGDGVGNSDTRTGFVAGAYLSLRLHRNFAIEPHLLYSQQGAEATVDVINGTFKLDYLQVPVLFKALFPLSGSPSARPFLAAGPALGFKVGCKVNVILSVDCDSISLPIKDTDFSVVAAGGIEVSDFVLSVRYGLGLSSIIDAGPISVKNRVLSFLVGYGFRFGAR